MSRGRRQGDECCPVTSLVLLCPILVPLFLSLSRPIVTSLVSHLNSPTPFNALTSNNLPLQPRLVFYKQEHKVS